MSLLYMMRTLCLVVFVCIFTCHIALADSGIGCLIDGGPGVIYRTELGDTNFYSTKYRVYSSAGERYYKVYSSTVMCGETTSAYIQNYSQPGYSGCWVSNRLNNTNDDSGAQYGHWVRYSNVTPCQLPLDDYIPFLIMASCLSVFFIYRNTSSDLP